MKSITIYHYNAFSKEPNKGNPAVYALKFKQLVNNENELIIETKVGILPIRIDSKADGEEYITMKLDSSQFNDFNGSYEELASIGLSRDDIESDLPTVYGSTG